jgi:predicted Zn-dependent peptidase
MYKLHTLSNGLTLITVDLPHLNSVTSLVGVGAGSRYEVKENNGISHFLEHMFFKGSKKYPSAEKISTIVDSIGAINNAATSKEWTSYYIKSSASHIELASDVLSSMLKDPLLAEDEIEREKGVILEELKMYKDMPYRYVGDLYEQLQFGDQPLGWEIGGDEKTVLSLKRNDLEKYIHSLYSAENMALVYVGKLPKDIVSLAEKYFANVVKGEVGKFVGFQKLAQRKPKVSIHYKKTDQANLVLGVEGFDRYDDRQYAAYILSVILGEGMSSRLFLQVRERRGLAYHINADHDPYKDAGTFTVYAGLKLDAVEEGLQVILAELNKMRQEDVLIEELNKAKEIIKGRIDLRTESTNFLAEHFGIEYILDKKLETFEEYKEKINAVTAEDIKEVASQLFKADRFNLQIIAPLKKEAPLEKLLANF